MKIHSICPTGMLGVFGGGGVQGADGAVEYDNTEPQFQ